MKGSLAIFAGLLATSLLVGCGEGPKHLSKSDYDHGQAAFNLLDQFATTGQMSILTKASEEMEATDTRSEVHAALVDYKLSLISLDLARDSRLKMQGVAPVVKICRDNAAQYFDSTVNSAGGCMSSLRTYQVTYGS